MFAQWSIWATLHQVILFFLFSFKIEMLMHHDKDFHYSRK
jgi:hypothetical protein